MTLLYGMLFIFPHDIISSFLYFFSPDFIDFWVGTVQLRQEFIYKRKLIHVRKIFDLIEGILQILVLM